MGTGLAYHGRFGQSRRTLRSTMHAPTAPLRCRYDTRTLYLFSGTIGARRVRATLRLTHTQVRGFVSAGRDDRDVAVTGTRAARALRIYAASKPQRLLFVGALTDCGSIAGSWLGTRPPQPLQLASEGELLFASLAHRYDAAGARSDALVDRRVRALRRAVLAGNRVRVSTLVAYPLRINAAGGARYIRNAGDLVRRYSTIFTRALIDAIRSGVPADLFARDQGEMLSDGTLWFDARGRLEAINPP